MPSRPSPYPGTPRLMEVESEEEYGQLYSRKVAKNFGQCAFLSAREIEHGRFRAFFVGENWAKVMIVELCPKFEKMLFSVGTNGRKKRKEKLRDGSSIQRSALSSQRKPKSTPTPEALYRRGRRGRKGENREHYRGLTRMIAD